MELGAPQSPAQAVIRTPRRLAPSGPVGGCRVRGRGGPREGKVGPGCRRTFRRSRQPRWAGAFRVVGARSGSESRACWAAAPRARRASEAVGSAAAARGRQSPRQLAASSPPLPPSPNPRTPGSNRAGGSGLQVCVSGPHLGSSRGNCLSMADFKIQKQAGQC